MHPSHNVAQLILQMGSIHILSLFAPLKRAYLHILVKCAAQNLQ